MKTWGVEVVTVEIIDWSAHTHTHVHFKLTLMFHIHKRHHSLSLESSLIAPVHGNIIFQLVNRTEPKERVNEGDNTWILFRSAKFAHSPIVVVHWRRPFLLAKTVLFVNDRRTRANGSPHPTSQNRKHMHLIENGIIQWAKQYDFVVVNLPRSDTLNYVICFFNDLFFLFLF